MRTLVSLGVVLVLATVSCKKEEKPAEEPEPEPKPAVEPKPVAPETPVIDTEAIERGRYLATVAGCAGCHTPVGPQGPDMSKMFAGGLEVQEAVGTWRAPNITPDEKTGIGSWTEEQIVTAIREGKRPDGTQMYPMMPYLYYNALSDEDARAIAVFLKSLEPIENAVPGSDELKLPKIPAPPPKGEAPPRDDPVKYGEYLATLMHCHQCHTPMTEKGPDMTKSWAGGLELEIPKNFEPMMGSGVIISPNITSDPKTGIGKWSKEDVKDSITKAVRPDGTPLAGPMQLYAKEWRRMKPEDLDAVATFIKQIPPVRNKVPKGTWKPPAHPPGAPGAEGHDEPRKN